MCVAVCDWSPGWALKMALDWFCLLAKALMPPYLSIISTHCPACLQDQCAQEEPVMLPLLGPGRPFQSLSS